jgi:hypothetical protein
VSEILDRIMGQIAAIARRVAHLETLEVGGGGAPSPHDILGAHHSISGGAALDLVGQSGAGAIARVTPSADPGLASAVLKTDTAGLLSLEKLDIGQWIDMASEAWVGTDTDNALIFDYDSYTGYTVIKLPDAATHDFSVFEVQDHNGVSIFECDEDTWAVGLPSGSFYVVGNARVGQQLLLGANIPVLGNCASRAFFYKAGIVDNVATNVFKITTTNEAGDTDGGAYSVSVHAVIGHAALNNGNNTAAKSFTAQFCRTMRDTGVGVNSAVSEVIETASAATDAATRDIDTVTMTVVETSEYVQTVQFTIDLTGTGVTTAEVTVLVDIVCTGFKTRPVLAAA